ncbi:MAG: sulfatase [Bryobacterales bacterium]|nr:sulfatase [Bryobacterales bacterium]
MLLSSAATMAAIRGSAQNNGQRPNILMIPIDDLNDWIGALGGHPQTITPNLDRLARSGVLFSNAHCQAPACNPSRASLMSGIRPTTSAVYRNGDLWRDGLPDAITLPEHFRAGGYYVAGGGKTFHGSQNDLSVWDDYYSFEPQVLPPNRPVNGIPKAAHFDWSPVDAADDETADTKLAHWAADFLRQDHDKPFFLACGFFRPHLPWYAPKKYFDLFPPEQTNLPEVLANDLDDVPPAAKSRSRRDHDNVTSTNQWKKAVASYLACINYTDANVGRVLDALEGSAYADNTVIVLWSDHGWQLGEKQQWRKFTLWERSTRVVMMMTAPGVTVPGGVCDRPAELLDIYPTLSELCGLPVRPELEGKSLIPLLKNPDAAWDKAAITSNGPDKTTVRTQRWRYSSFSDGEELYDHDNDPNEWSNLAGDPQHAELKERMKGYMPSNVNRKKLKQYVRPPSRET